MDEQSVPMAASARPLTDAEYWSALWSRSRLRNTVASKRFDPVSRQLIRHIRDHAPFGAGTRVLEVGCAASAWLPFFHTEWEWSVEGIDYSPAGCSATRANLASLGVPGEIYQADLFDFARLNRSRYDVVISFGVVEHFLDPERVVRAMTCLIRPGGVLVVQVPYLRGLSGRLQTLASRQVMAMHNPLGPDDLVLCFRAAGLVETWSSFVGRAPLGVVNWPLRNNWPRPLWLASMVLQRALDLAIALASKAAHLPQRWVATGVLAIGQKPTEEH